jgi:hypothetical protein
VTKCGFGSCDVRVVAIAVEPLGIPTVYSKNERNV